MDVNLDARENAVVGIITFLAQRFVAEVCGCLDYSCSNMAKTGGSLVEDGHDDD